MTYMILRLLYSIYFMGIGGVFFISMGRLLFGSGKFKRRLVGAAKAIAVSPLWPLMAATPSGRKAFRKNINPEI